MADIVIVGDGPAGLSAALFLGKNGHATTVYGQDETAMHYALLRNYLGIDEIPGTQFQQRAREQVARHGATIIDEAVTAVRAEGDGFVVTTESGESTADYLILAPGKKGAELAGQLGIDSSQDGVGVDGHYRATVDRVYVAGRLARPTRSQAIISAGAGAIAALDIMSREAGQDVTDWDSPDEE